MLIKIWGNKHTHILLVGVQITESFWKESMNHSNSKYNCQKG